MAPPCGRGYLGREPIIQSGRPTSALVRIPDSPRALRHFRKVPLATNAPQQTASLFNHVVSKSEQRRRHSEAERLGGLQVDE
jgi:hypothetical protein